MKVVYIAHKLSASSQEGMSVNRELAKDWLAHCAKLGNAPIASWIPLSERWSEEEGRELGLKIDVKLIERCDEVWLCGPVVSAGMKIEAEAAERLNIPVVRMEEIPCH